jgi:archaellum component FlaF (FlaF/FlaG flagellin family)
MPTLINKTVPTYFTGNSTDTTICTAAYSTDLSEMLNSYVGMKDTPETRRRIYSSLNNYVIDTSRNYNVTNPNLEVTINGTRVGTTEDFAVVHNNTTVGYNYIAGDFTGNTTFTPLYNYNFSLNSTFNEFNLSKRDIKLSRLRQNLSPVVKSRCEEASRISVEEAIAMEALREVVTEDEFKRYLRYGFVMVRGRSGAAYQVYRNRSHVKVWVGGKVIEEICVYLKAVNGKMAPNTDKVVAFKAMIESDEEAFKTLGNRYRMAA